MPPLFWFVFVSFVWKIVYHSRSFSILHDEAIFLKITFLVSYWNFIQAFILFTLWKACSKKSFTTITRAFHPTPQNRTFVRDLIERATAKNSLHNHKLFIFPQTTLDIRLNSKCRQVWERNWSIERKEELKYIIE